MHAYSTINGRNTNILWFFLFFWLFTINQICTKWFHKWRIQTCSSLYPTGVGGTSDYEWTEREMSSRASYMWKLIKLPTSLFVKLMKGNECQRNEWISMTNEVDVFSLPKIWEVVNLGPQLDPKVERLYQFWELCLLWTWFGTLISPLCVCVCGTISL